LLSLK